MTQFSTFGVKVILYEESLSFDGYCRSIAHSSVANRLKSSYRCGLEYDFVRLHATVHVNNGHYTFQPAFIIVHL
jgi:hypothetical protein